MLVLCGMALGCRPLRPLRGLPPPPDARVVAADASAAPPSVRSVGLRWRAPFANEFGASEIAIAGGVVAVSDAARTVFYDRESGRTIRSRVGGCEFSGGGPLHPHLAECGFGLGELFVRIEDGWLIGGDPRTNASRWRRPCVPGAAGPGYTCEGTGALSGPIAVIMAGSYDRFDLVGIDVETGATRWRSPLGYAYEMRADSASIAVSRYHELRVFESGTGRLLWTRATADGFRPQLGERSVELVDATVAFLEDSDAVALYHAPTGRRLVRVAQRGAHVTAFTLRGGRLFMTSLRDGTPEGPASGASVAAFDIRSGRRLWERSEGRYDVLGARIAADAHAVYVLVGTETLRALDAASGDELWSWQLGPRALFAHDARSDVAAVVASTGQEILSLTEDARGAPAEAFTISGLVRVGDTPLPSARVRVGEHVVVADARGRFSVTSRGRGVVAVQSMGGLSDLFGVLRDRGDGTIAVPDDSTPFFNRCLRAGPPTMVPLSGRGQYSVDIVLQEQGCSED